MISRVCGYGQKGMCYYLIGVHDDGEAVGISSNDMIKTLWVLYQMAYENQFDIEIMDILKGKEGEIC